MEVPDKTYLGDGVYCEFDAGLIRVTTDNGISVTNEIYMEPEVFAGLEKFAAAVRLASVAGWRVPQPAPGSAAASALEGRA